MKNLIKSNPILSYLLLTFIISWLFWFTPMIINLPNDIYFGIILVGGFGPAISGLILLHLQSGKKIEIASKPLFWMFFLLFGLLLVVTHYLVNHEARLSRFWYNLKDIGLLATIILFACCLFWGLLVSNSKNNNIKENYLKSFLFDSTKIKWYAFAFLFYPILYALGFVFGKLFNFETSESLFTPDIYFISGFLLTFFIAGAEEFGWRGFFQKELQKKYNPLITSILIALVWSSWHIPLHYNGFYSSDFYFLDRFLVSFQLALLFTWCYNKSGYSILTVMILHTMNNNVGKIFGSSYYPAMTLGIIIVLIFIIDNKMWKRKDYHNEIYTSKINDSID